MYTLDGIPRSSKGISNSFARWCRNAEPSSPRLRDLEPPLCAGSPLWWTRTRQSRIRQAPLSTSATDSGFWLTRISLAALWDSRTTSLSMSRLLSSRVNRWHDTNSEIDVLWSQAPGTLSKLSTESKLKPIRSGQGSVNMIVLSLASICDRELRLPLGKTGNVPRRHGRSRIWGTVGRLSGAYIYIPFSKKTTSKDVACQ